MKFTLSWLKDHLETELDAAALADAMTDVGLEVEDLFDPGPALAPFTVALVKTADKHPNADRLKLLTVDTGKTELQVVCGAPNARAGMKGVLAQPGDVIPASGEALKTGKIRGVESQGMMCSARELLLGEDHDGIIELPEDARIGAPVADVLPLDPVFDLSITPNRPDCFGVRGIARDLAAAGHGRLKPLNESPVPGRFKSSIGVARDLPGDRADACAIFVGRYISGVANGPSPKWLQDRLAAIGLKPISALVDITNFFAVDQARPLHVFDADRLSGNIVARFARPDETLAALNDRTYRLEPDMTVIADDAGAQGLGGVIGGTATSVTEDTVNVFLESAWFEPMGIARTGRALGIDSDARHRFERGVDPASCLSAAEQATRMILELCGGEPSEPVVAGAAPDWRREIAFRPDRIARHTGVEVPLDRIVGILASLGCEIDGKDPMTVRPPSHRPDLTAEHDLIEEVIRIHGYRHIAETPLPRALLPAPALSPDQHRLTVARRTLAGRGLNETLTWAFCADHEATPFLNGGSPVTLANPISSDLAVLRPSLLANLLSAAQRNAARGFPDLALFEIGPMFLGGAPGEQREAIAGIRAGRTGPKHWTGEDRDIDVFDAKADAIAALYALAAPARSLQTVRGAPHWYHPGRAGTLRLGPKDLSYFGEIHPRLLRALDIRARLVAFEVFPDAVPLPKARPTKTQPLLAPSAFQPVGRDFAFLVDSDTDAEKAIRAALSADKSLISGVDAFDSYEGENVDPGKRSLALTVTLQPVERPLTDEDLAAVSRKIVGAVEKATGGTLRH